MYPGLTYEQQKAKVKGEAEAFPLTFGLRGFPESTFRVNLGNSYIHDRTGEVVLYLDIRHSVSGEWQAFGKGSAAELKREILSLSPLEVPDQVSTDRPNWKPLERRLSLASCGDWMWMFRTNGIEHYKNIHTRHYLVLDAQANAYGMKADGKLVPADFDEQYAIACELHTRHNP